MRWIALMLLMVFLAGALEACAAYDSDPMKPTIKRGGFSGFKSSSKRLKTDLDDDDDDDGGSGGWWLLAAIVIVLIVVVVLAYIFFTRRGTP
ncbi:hypothetical protein FVF72_04030 [Methanothermobacter sp. KEPCO-1]|uniref:hypothetical protein n=1 Tax=Methanothermobacter sp. KEPCO-1 TaxID=2603820 RepID=UPI0011C9A54A|nr:hypothetical protein [Methanothermobacter sp. KEPCO-1]QEF94397.1 hypothetical protein FVF72_04030 [Methanothermobacter sp. KEPCO-1]